MRIEATLLRSKVARRIFFLFVACAMLPVVALTVFSSQVMTSHLEEQAQLRLRHSTKSAGMALLGRLSMVESELRTLALVADADTGEGKRWEAMARHMESRVNGVALVSSSGTRSLFGSTPSAAEFARQGHLAAGAGVVRLALTENRGARNVVLLGLVLESASFAGPGESRALVAQVSPTYLWNLDEDIELLSGTELLVLNSDGEPLFSTLDSSNSRVESSIGANTGSLHGEFNWSVDGTAHRGYSWSMFLKPQFGCSGWTVVLSEPNVSGIQSLTWASKILPLVIALCMLVVAMLSLVQIRKSLVPIVSLQEGTRQIAAGNFGAQVRVATNDEFTQLADSFNAMAGRLGRQFETLNTMAAIDRELLSTLREDQIVRTLLSRTPERFRCDRAAVTVGSLDGSGSMLTRVRLEDASTAEELAILTDTERYRLFSRDEPFALSADALPAHLAEMLGEGLAECLVVPIRTETINGCMTLGFKLADRCTGEVRTEARRLAAQAGVALSNARLLEQLEQVNRETLYALARAVDANSPWTAGHSERVTGMALELAQRLEVSDEQLGILHRGGLLHDVGKIGVPGYILDKPGRLTDEEFETMRDHPRIGARILEPISAYRDEIPIVLHHHERYDGTGYPDRLAGTDIPYLARILSVADVYDALVSDRPYRAGWTVQSVVEFIEDAAGTQFDPDVVAVFLDLMQSRNRLDQPIGVEPCLITDEIAAAGSPSSTLRS